MNLYDNCRYQTSFDFLTFGALLFLLNANAEQFRTGWFLESVMTELLILPVIRTWRPFYQSRPSKPLWMATVIVLAVTLALPYLPLNKWLGFSPLPVSFILIFAGITGGYLIASEITKKFFYRRGYELLSPKPGSRGPDSWMSR